MIFVETEGGGPSACYTAINGELCRVAYTTLTGEREEIDLRDCRKFDTLGPEGTGRRLFLTPDDRWILELGEWTEDEAPSYHEISAAEAIPGHSHVASNAGGDRADLAASPADDVPRSFEALRQDYLEDYAAIGREAVVRGLFRKGDRVAPDGSPTVDHDPAPEREASDAVRQLGETVVRGGKKRVGDFLILMGEKQQASLQDITKRLYVDQKLEIPRGAYAAIRQAASIARVEIRKAWLGVAIESKNGVYRLIVSVANHTGITDTSQSRDKQPHMLPSGRAKTTRGETEHAEQSIVGAAP